jgi:hypothetical protein
LKIKKCTPGSGEIEVKYVSIYCKYSIFCQSFRFGYCNAYFFLIGFFGETFE